MKKIQLLLLISLIIPSGELKAQQKGQKTSILYTIPGLNLGIGIPNHDRVKEDRLDLGLSAELLKTGLWVRKGPFGIISEIGLLYYDSYVLYFFDWLLDNSINPLSLQGGQWNRTLVAALLGTYQIHSAKRAKAYLLGGLAFRSERWHIDNSQLFNGWTGGPIFTGEQTTGRLYYFEAKMAHPFLYYRVGASLLIEKKLPINLRFWTDLFPPYDFEYEVNEISSWPNQEYATKNRSYWFWTIGVSAELYGVFTR